MKKDFQRDHQGSQGQYRKNCADPKRPHFIPVNILRGRGDKAYTYRIRAR
jgi:hypothetical protein